MTDTPNESNFEADVNEVMKTLPVPIRNYLATGEYSVVAHNLMDTYALHVDQGAILERELAALLMGVDSPEEFATSLQTEATIPATTVQSIMADLNQQVFVPLQEEMKKAATQPAAPVASVAATPTPAPAAPIAVRVAPATPILTPKVPSPALATAPLPPKVVMPATPTPAAGLSPLQAALQKVAPVAYSAGAATKAPQMPARVAPVASPTSPSMPMVTPKANPIIPATPIAPAKAPAKPYSADPYREPLE